MSGGIYRVKNLQLFYYNCTFAPRLAITLESLLFYSMFLQCPSGFAGMGLRDEASWSQPVLASFCSPLTSLHREVCPSSTVLCLGLRPNCLRLCPFCLRQIPLKALNNVKSFVCNKHEDNTLVKVLVKFGDYRG
jgi:hypothetical protein